MRGICFVFPSAVVTVIVLELVRSGILTREANWDDIMSCVQPPSIKILAVCRPLIIAVTCNRSFSLTKLIFSISNSVKVESSAPSSPLALARSLSASSSKLAGQVLMPSVAVTPGSATALSHRPGTFPSFTWREVNRFPTDHRNQYRYRFLPRVCVELLFHTLPNRWLAFSFSYLGRSERNDRSFCKHSTEP